MEIIYLWIESEGNIYRTGFSFSTEFNIKYFPETMELEIKRGEKRETSLFNNSFSNITVLVGKNGSGKSTILSTINSLINHNNIWNNNNFLIIKINKNTLKFVNLNYKCQITKQDNSIQIQNNGDISSNIELLFYSNTFNIYDHEKLNRIGLSLQRNIDYSLNETIQYCLDKYDMFLQKIDSGEIEKKDLEKYRKQILRSDFVFYQTLFQDEIKNQLNFVAKSKYKTLDFIPNSIRLSFNFDFFNENKEKITSKGFDFDKVIKFYKSSNSAVLNINQANEEFIQRLTIFLVFNIVTNNVFSNKKAGLIQSLVEIFNNNESITVIAEKFLKICTLESEKRFYLYYSYSIFKNLKSKINELKIYRWVDNLFYFELDEKLFAFFNEIFSYWNSFPFLFNIQWNKLSSGESALLSIFSRLNYIRSYTNNIVVIIDEGELYLHPEWQRKFFYDLHENLPKLFEGTTIQLLFTSHSPFIISDLPKENVLLLDRGKNGQCIIKDESHFKNTFGTNIHALLSNSFFLENGYIGEFARWNIDYAFEWLNNRKSISPEEDGTRKIREIIRVIGDPLVKMKLVELFAQKIGEDGEIERLNEQKKLLDEKIKQLKQKKHDSD
jgi:predicted ATP-binding protein involved in virulence